MANLRRMCFQRTASAIIWSVIMEIMVLVTILFIDINVFRPLFWSQSSFSRTLPIGTWMYFFILGVLLFAHCVVAYNKELMTISRFSGTRLALIKHFFSLHNLVSATLYILLGGVIACVYLALLGGEYSSLTVKCKHSSNVCLVEANIYLITNGFWSGLIFFLSNYMCGFNSVMFPVVQQLKFLQIKSKVMPSLKEAMLCAIWPTLTFPLLYLWRGIYFQEQLSDSLGFANDDNSLASAVDFLLLLPYSWIFSTIFMFAVIISKHLFQVYLTEHRAFVVFTKMGDRNVTTLCEAMAMTGVPIFQSLGYLDFMNLSEKDSLRRQELFTLSQPGGHPYNWNAVVKECLTLINTFTTNLETSITPAVFNKPTNNVPTQPTTSILKHHNPNLRNLSITRVETSWQQEQQPNAFRLRITFEELILYLKFLWHTLLKKPGFNYIFGELPDARVRHVLSQGRSVIWASQGIALLVAASLKEDRYGIVLKDLPNIIGSLLKLKQALEKIPKSSNYKRSQKNEHYDSKMKMALKSATKRSLYRICITFGDDLKELDLSKHTWQQLQMYLSFRES